MDRQELVDRLVTAVEEEDMLYVLFWLKEMEKEGLLRCGEENGKGVLLVDHSWKGHSALVAAVKQPSSVLRVAILELLLLQPDDPLQSLPLGMTEWKEQSWAVDIVRRWKSGRKEQARHAQYLLSLDDLEDATKYIDLHFPPHPNADSMTGCGPLPPRPPPPPATLRQLAPPPSTLELRVHPSLPPSSWGDPRSQIRLSSLNPEMSLEEVEAVLPALSGFAGAKVLNESTVILCFVGESMAEAALPLLQNRQDGAVAQLELAYQISIGHGPPPRQAPPPAPSPLTPPLAPRSTSSPKPSTAPVRLHIKNLPLDSTITEVQDLFAGAGVDLQDLQPILRPGAEHIGYVAFIASADDYVRAASKRHRFLLRGFRMYINREPPMQRELSHPFVVVHGLSLSSAGQTMYEVSRRAGCGGYELEAHPAKDGRTALGWMRVEGEKTAELAVRHITGQQVAGVQVWAEWVSAEEAETKLPLQEKKRPALPLRQPRPPSTSPPPPPPPLPPGFSSFPSPTSPLRPLRSLRPLTEPSLSSTSPKPAASTPRRTTFIDLTLSPEPPSLPPTPAPPSPLLLPSPALSSTAKPLFRPSREQYPSPSPSPSKRTVPLPPAPLPPAVLKKAIASSVKKSAVKRGRAEEEEEKERESEEEKKRKKGGVRFFFPDAVSRTKK